jgi:hypothetical protein
MQAIRCSCGAKILLFPKVKVMSEKIETDIDKDKQKIINSKAAET